MTRRLAAVFAHPDDDTYGIAGTVALHRHEDLALTVVLATSGEAGRIFDDSLAARETLGAVREAEDRASWAEIGVEPDLRLLRHPDGGLAGMDRAELVAEVEAILHEVRPDVVVTFGPEGVTGHEDHIAIGAATTEAFHRVRSLATDGPRRLLHVALRQSRLDRFDQWLRARGMDPLDPTQPFVPRGVPDADVGVVVDCSSVYERKLEALRRHRTQAELEDIPFELWPTVLGEEAFVLAWPESPPGARPLADVFDGLPAA
ncbi:MAG TPA: PIG-L family deacetylase [Actinomycetota bacterium]|nr:PIG-L family deacetylase [Actinomycetota bacterium]